MNKILPYSFWFYNKGGELLRRRKRNQKGKIENSHESHRPH